MSSFELLHNDENSSFVLDPRTKLLVLLIINIVMIAGGITGVVFYIRIMLAMIPFLLLICSKKNYKTAFIYLSAFAFATFGEGVVIRYATGNINLVFLLLSGIISRFVPGLMMGYYVMTSTTVSEFIAAMERMHITKKITIPFCVMFRYFPTISEENKAIASAMKMRGIGLKGKRNNLVSLLEYRLVPIMMSTVKIGDELSAASLTKGLDSDVKRTNICNIGIGCKDILLCIFVVVCFICFLLN